MQTNASGFGDCSCGSGVVRIRLDPKGVVRIMHSLAINSTVFLVTFRALRAELIMGAAASAMVPDSSISLDKAKELAGHLWSAELEAKV